jgi:hypothetical protein
MVASPRDCDFCVDFGTLNRAATNRLGPRWNRPVNPSPVSDASDLHGTPLEENRRANPSNAPCLRRVSGDVRLMDSDAKELGHERAADRPLGLPSVKRSHTFLRWQRGQLARECYRAGLRREQYASGSRAIQNGGPRCTVWVESGRSLARNQSAASDPPAAVGMRSVGNVATSSVSRSCVLERDVK